MPIHSLLDVLLTLHAGIVPNYRNLVLCQFAMVLSSQTVSLMLGIHYSDVVVSPRFVASFKRRFQSLDF